MVPEDVPRLSALPLRDRQDLATEGRVGVLWGDLTAVSSLGQANAPGAWASGSQVGCLGIGGKVSLGACGT